MEARGESRRRPRMSLERTCNERSGIWRGVTVISKDAENACIVPKWGPSWPSNTPYLGLQSVNNFMLFFYRCLVMINFNPVRTRRSNF